MPHAPIRITNDAEFCPSIVDSPTRPLLGSGVVNCDTADGSRERPYVIEGWLIDAAGYVPCVPVVAQRMLNDDWTVGGILVGGTSKHVIIRNNAVAATAHDLACKNFVNHVFAAHVGIYAAPSSGDVEIDGNDIIGHKTGIVACGPAGATTVRVTGNTVIGASQWGMQICPPAIVDGNTVSGSLNGIAILGRHGAYVTGNTLTHNLVANLRLQSTDSPLVARNTLHDAEAGLWATFSSNLTLERNVVTHNGLGFQIEQAFRTAGISKISDNDFDRNGVGIQIEQGADFFVLRNNAFSNSGLRPTAVNAEPEGLGTARVALRMDTLVDARQNWWGHETGPSGTDNPGAGDAIEGDAQYSPWLTNAPQRSQAAVTP